MVFESRPLRLVETQSTQVIINKQLTSFILLIGTVLCQSVCQSNHLFTPFKPCLLLNKYGSHINTTSLLT